MTQTLHAALMVDRNGVLNTASFDVSNAKGWQGPDTVGNASLVPGSPVAILQLGNTIFTALMVDRNGVLNTASFDVSNGNGWEGPDTVGKASLVPGSPIAICQMTSLIFTALMVDRNGALNVASLDITDGKGWQGPDTVGNTNLVPGSPVAIFQQSSSIFTALMVDRNGVLNTASFDVSNAKGWQGPDTLGNASLVPGSVVATF